MHRRLEQSVVCLPLLLLWLHHFHFFFLDTQPIPKHIHSRWENLSTLYSNESGDTSISRMLFESFIFLFDWTVTVEGMGRIGGLIIMTVIAIVIQREGDREDKHQRRGASGGLLLGCLALPLVFAAQLHLHQHLGVAPVVTSLFWLSLCCSIIALVAAYTGESVSDLDGPGLTELFTSLLLAQMAMAVQDMLMFADTLVVCYLFSYLLYFLLHKLRFSFTPGEAITVATMLALLFTHAIFSFLAHLLTWMPRPSWWRAGLANWARRAMILDISSQHPSKIVMTSNEGQSVAYYNACMTLLVGVLLLGVLWFGPFALAYKRMRTKHNKLMKKQTPIELNVRPVEDEADDPKASPPAPESTSSKSKKEKKLKQRRNMHSVASSSEVDHSHETDESKEDEHLLPRQRRSSSAAVLSSSSSSPWTQSPARIWMLLILIIFGVIYPYIWLEMHTEPFTFIWRYLFSVPPNEEISYKRQGDSIESFSLIWRWNALYSSLYKSIGIFQSAHPVTAIKSLTTHFLQSLRGSLALYWCLVMAVFVFLLAPTGRARSHTTSSSSSSTTSSHTDTSVNTRMEGNEVISTRTTTTTAGDAVTGSQTITTSTITVNPSGIESESFTNQFSWRNMPNILVRKYYHFMAVGMFVPAILMEPGFVGLSFAVALSIFVLTEYMRIARLPPFGERIQQFMKSYLDIRDSGIVILTHAYLLLGCALPLWLHLHVLSANDRSILTPSFDSNLSFMQAFTDRLNPTDEDAAATRYGPSGELVWDMRLYLPAMAGILVLGIGDSMASLVGVWLGRVRWFNTSRTIEGTLAAILSIFLFTFGLIAGMEWMNTIVFNHALTIISPNWFLFLFSTIFTCLLEASTSQIDNLYLPLYYYTAMLLIGL